MSDEDLKIAQDWLTQYVCKTPGIFKICEGCDAIASEVVALCPLCGAYRFDNDTERVKSHLECIIKNDVTIYTKASA